MGMENLYKRSLQAFMRVRWIALLIVGGCAGIIFFLGKKIPSELAPMEDRNRVRVSVTGPEGADFDFTDEGWEQRRLGTTRPDVLVFAEKTGWIRLLRRWHERWGVSILALGGFPSALTSEYTATHLAPLIGEKTVQLIGIVDFDPSGSLIASSFRGQLEASGLKVSEPRLLIEPKHYKDEELRMFAYPLPQSQKTKLSNWLEETGGIKGEAMGLESESLPIERLEGLLEALLGD